MTAIIFRTPGSLDMRAFTTMGVNAKPNTPNPIGYFGTGLKYAVAVLCRLGATFVVYTNGQRYWFETKPLDFRGSAFDQIVMRRDSWVGGQGWRLGRRLKLPFTTTYGRNWEPWMAFRELHSNTLDEQGETWEADQEEYEDILSHQTDTISPATFIVVSGCEEFTQAYRDRAAIFLELGNHPVEASLPGLEVRAGETQRLFYQGMRAKDVGKPTLHTYNFTTGQDLTEDRQLAHEWQVRGTLANIIAGYCEDEQLIEQVITAKDNRWEHGLEPSSWVKPSAAFHRVMMRRPRGVGGGWGSYYGTHDRRPEAVKKDLWRDALRPWKVDGGDVLAADGTALFSKPFNMNEEVWKTLAGRMVEIANRQDAQYFGKVVVGETEADAPGRRWIIQGPLDDASTYEEKAAHGAIFNDVDKARGRLDELPAGHRLYVIEQVEDGICPGCDNTLRVCKADRLCERAWERDPPELHQPGPLPAPDYDIPF